MSRSPESRFVLVDFAIILALILIGWTIYTLVQIEPKIAVEKEQSVALQEIFSEGQRLLRGNTNDLELARRELDLSWYDAMLLKSEYLSVAERLDGSLPQLQLALSNSTEGKAARSSALREMQSWIQKENERVSIERLTKRSKDLQARMTRAQSQQTNGVAPPAADLGTLVGGIAKAYQSFLADIEGLADNAGKPLASGLAAQHRERGKQQLLNLSSFADQARQSGEAIEEFLKIQSSAETLKRRRREDELIHAFSEAGSPAELIRQLQIRHKNSNTLHAISPELLSLRTVRYALVAALAGLGIFLVLDLYWRLVVAPLRLKLREREGQIEHQKKLAHFEELAAELAHEIRNPLTAISALLYTVQRKLHAGTPEHKDAAVIRNELDRVNQILKEFIQMTKPAPPKLELMDAASLLTEVSDLMSPELQRQSVRLERQTPGHAQFYGDQQQLKQVLINLIQNAAESFDQQNTRPNEGAVVLRARDEKMPFNGTPANVAVIEVEDNGPGIRPEVRARLFEPFFSTKKAGTGLGLPISARIIDRHGGRLDVETQPGRGTTFRIVLLAHEQRN